MGVCSCVEPPPSAAKSYASRGNGRARSGPIFLTPPNISHSRTVRIHPTGRTRPSSVDQDRAGTWSRPGGVGRPCWAAGRRGQHGRVASLRDLLQRYRPVGTPGAAARPGVPADRAAEVATELEPVLALLAATEDEARRLRAEAREQAHRIREQAAREAEDLVAGARERAAEVRARSAADARAAAAPDGELLVEAARDEAHRMKDRAAALMPEYVDRAVATALSGIARTDEVVP